MFHLDELDDVLSFKALVSGRARRRNPARPAAISEGDDDKRHTTTVEESERRVVIKVVRDERTGALLRAD